MNSRRAIAFHYVSIEPPVFEASWSLFGAASGAPPRSLQSPVEPSRDARDRAAASEVEASLSQSEDELFRGPAGDEGLAPQVHIVGPDPVARDGARRGDVGGVPRVDPLHHFLGLVPEGPEELLGDRIDAAA